ncbi:MAG: methyltransferase domain-containing protein [Acidimicrobiales bacterium]
MPLSPLSLTLGVVVVHQPPGPVAELPAVRDLLPQVSELLVVLNGEGGAAEGCPAGTRVLAFETNRGTAAAWNGALAVAREKGFRYLYLLDQDSVPGPAAVASALDRIDSGGAAAVVQPPATAKYGLDPFPWNTVASGTLYDVDVLAAVGGFDERLFVDEVDHELHARLIEAGYTVTALPAATIDHRAGAPREIRMGRRTAVLSGHSVERRRLQGYSAGLLVRRYLRRAPATSARLLLRQAVTMAKDLVGGERRSVGALAAGLVSGVATGGPPAEASRCACPYCDGPLVGRFGAVPDWRFGTGAPGDVYRCLRCGALAAGRVPDEDEVASWYSEYYTHAVEPAPNPLWRRFWPTPGRLQEMEHLRWYCTPPAPAGRLLEVGTGSGERLVQFADAGWDVVGQDIDPKAGHLARERGIEVHQCPVADLVGREEPFDLIGLSHVLEHATAPAEMLRACAALLAPGGRICVISPNAQGLGRLLFGRWWFGLEQPRHLAIPTVESLERLSAGLGLETEDAATMATNGAVILGGSLARPLYERLPPGALQRVARFSTALLGQAIGRVAVGVDPRLGEEVVWAGRRAGPGSAPGPPAHHGEADGAGGVEAGVVGG